MTDPAAEPDSSDRQPPLQFNNHGSLRANLLLWGIPIALVVLIVVINIGSGVVAPVDSVQVSCEGYTGIDHSECAPWGREVLNGQLPQGHTLRDVSELTIRRSLFGLIDHCTAEFVMQGGGSIQHETACR